MVDLDSPGEDYDDDGFTGEFDDEESEFESDFDDGAEPDEPEPDDDGPGGPGPGPGPRLAPGPKHGPGHPPGPPHRHHGGPKKMPGKKTPGKKTPGKKAPGPKKHPGGHPPPPPHEHRHGPEHDQPGPGGPQWPEQPQRPEQDFGFGPGATRGFGPGFGFGPGGRGRRRGSGAGRRGRRGDVRAAILRLLAEGPMHGYEMIQEIAERSQDLWRPSPGSVYPTLQMLDDEGLVLGGESAGGKRLFELTDDGRAAAEKIKTPPWEEIAQGADPGEIDLRTALAQLFTAASQVLHVATADQHQRVVALINKVRREIYSILAESD